MSICFPPILAGHAVTLRPQTADDIGFVETVYVTHRTEEMLMLDHWTDEQRTSFLKDQFRLQWKHYETHYQGSEFLVIEVDGQPVGRFYYFDEHPKELRIAEIGFLPEWRRRGLGGAVLRQVQDYARSAGKFCSIHVEQTNPARSLYERLGFREVKAVGPYVLLEWRPE